MSMLLFPLLRKQNSLKVIISTENPHHNLKVEWDEVVNTAKTANVKLNDCRKLTKIHNCFLKAAEKIFIMRGK